jgi:hypothetical protein
LVCELRQLGGLSLVNLLSQLASVSSFFLFPFSCFITFIVGNSATSVVKGHMLLVLSSDFSFQILLFWWSFGNRYKAQTIAPSTS